MYVSHISLRNWRNFKSAGVDLNQRAFLVGPNASGKSNFLDALQFLKDIAKQGGGLQEALSNRGGLSKVRCLAARRDPIVKVEVQLSEFGETYPRWKYSIGVRQEQTGLHQPIVEHEMVTRGDEVILSRPDPDDRKDKERLKFTFLEQVTTNTEFREVAKFFESISYQHLIPQLVRQPEAFSGPGVPGDPYGKTFLERILQTPEKIRKSRLRKIEIILGRAVPQLTELHEIRDDFGRPHLEFKYEHWRPTGAMQREDQFSDGTLRLFGLLWAMLDGDATLLLEEPELSLHAGIVRQLPEMIYRMLREKKRQVILTTHSWELLSNKGIGGEEVILLIPGKEGTSLELASMRSDVRALLEGGLTVADAVLPLTRPNNIEQLAFL